MLNLNRLPKKIVVMLPILHLKRSIIIVIMLLIIHFKSSIRNNIHSVHCSVNLAVKYFRKIANDASNLHCSMLSKLRVYSRHQHDSSIAQDLLLMAHNWVPSTLCESRCTCNSLRCLENFLFETGAFNYCDSGAKIKHKIK